MIFQVSNKIKVMNQLKSLNLLWAYTSFQPFKQVQFFLRVSLEGKNLRKIASSRWLYQENFVFNFRIIKPNITYWKWLWYELTFKMAFIEQYITIDGKNLVKKEKAITQ